MSDDLSPAEQARAARWAADWLSDAGFDVSETARDAMSSLSFHADEMDPPETVESLRAERDEALAEMEEVGAAWRQEQIMHQKAWTTIRILQAELARLHDIHVDAEAARGRCARED